MIGTNLMCRQTLSVDVFTIIGYHSPIVNRGASDEQKACGGL